jgi:hypothetical protein
MVYFYKEILVKVEEDDRLLSFTKSILLDGRRDKRWFCFIKRFQLKGRGMRYSLLTNRGFN